MILSNREYRFRLSVSTAHGEHMYSDLVAVRTRLHNDTQQSQLKEHRHEQYERQERVISQPPHSQQQQRSSVGAFEIENQHKSNLSEENQKNFSIQQQLKGSASQQQHQKRPSSGSHSKKQLQKSETPSQQQLQKEQVKIF
jgi:hypothetical protein